LTQDTTGDRASIDQRRFAAYASWHGPLTVSGVAVYGNHSIDATRLGLLPGVVTQGSLTANSLDAGLEVSKTYSLAVVDVQPMLGLIYDGLWTDRFTEAGGGLLGITANSTDIAALRGYAGARFYRTYGTAGGMALTPELRARVAYDFLNDRRGFNAIFTTDPTATVFAVNGLQPDRTSALLGAGVTAKLASQWRAFVNYDADLRGNAVSQMVNGGVAVRW
jgi:outer membrane autotransporter protein